MRRSSSLRRRGSAVSGQQDKRPANSSLSRFPVSSAAMTSAIVILTLLANPARAQLNEVIDAQVKADRAAAQSQQRIDETRDRTQDAAASYAQSVAEAESLQKYNKQLEAQVLSQEAEIASIAKQLLDIETTNREIQPLMQQMVGSLKEFVSLDVPFLIEERARRVQNLEDLLSRADVTISEKYRRILEAYQIELEYGRTLEAYEGKLAESGEGGARTVEFVRLGRLSLMYRTRDGEETGYWDRYQRKWIVDNDYADAVQEALRVAKKSGSPDLLTVPVPAPREAEL
jgi:hypothetical protein